MSTLFYSTGQAARELSTTPAAVRKMCESGAIAAETTTGGQWRVAADDVARLKRDGLPPIPRPLPIETRTAPKTAGIIVRRSNYENAASSEVTSSADLVAIKANTLETRRIDRQIEENEDWFRERQRQREIENIAEREQAQVRVAEQRRRRWANEWLNYALNSAPYAALREVEIEIVRAIKQVLAELSPTDSSSIIRRVIDATVLRETKPWQRRNDVEKAFKACLETLPRELLNNPTYAPLKKNAHDAAVEATRRFREDADYREMENALGAAIQPTIRMYEHCQNWVRIVDTVFILGATYEEAEAAKEEVGRALQNLPVGTPRTAMERIRETTLAPFKSGIAARKEQERVESEKRTKQILAEGRTDHALTHVSRYLLQKVRYASSWQMSADAERLCRLIREPLIEEILKNPTISTTEMEKSIERRIDAARRSSS